MTIPILTTWRSSDVVAADVRLSRDTSVAVGERLSVFERTSPEEFGAHAAAEGLLWRARVCSARGQLTVPAQLRTLPALAAPAVVVLAAVLEAVGLVSLVEVYGRFALAPSDATWIVEGALVAACLAELTRRRFVEFVGELVRASARTRAVVA